MKAGHTTSSRTVRQKQKMRDVVTFLSSGSGVMEDKFVEVERLDIVPENGLSELGELLKESGIKGWASKRISNCLYVECVDFRKVESENLGPLLEEKETKDTADWKERGDTVVSMNSLDLVSYAPNCAPFSIFPFGSEICVDLMVGAKCYVASFNVTAVEREFQYRGWDIEKTFKEQMAAENEDAMLVVRKGGYEVHLPPGELMRSWMELMRVAVVIKHCEVGFRKGPTKEGYSYTVYGGEPAIWD